MALTFDPRFGRTGWEVIQAGKRLGRSGLIAGAEGNLSCRLDDDSILITCAGARKDELTPGDLSIVSLDGSLKHGEKRPSTELAMHLAAYRSRRDVGAAIHGHPIAATAFAAAEKSPSWTALAESIASLGEVRLASFAEPGTRALSNALEPLLPACDAFLLAHHGAFTLGHTLEQALQRMELLERLCAIECQAAALGGVVNLPEAYVISVRPTTRG